MNVLTADQFIKTKRKQPNVRYVRDGHNRMGSIPTTGDLLFGHKKNEALAPATTWMDREGITLGQRGQAHQTL